MSKKEKEQRHGNPDMYLPSLAVTILKPGCRYEITALPTSSQACQVTLVQSPATVLAAFNISRRRDMLGGDLDSLQVGQEPSPTPPRRSRGPNGTHRRLSPRPLAREVEGALLCKVARRSTGGTGTVPGSQQRPVLLLLAQG